MNLYEKLDKARELVRTTSHKKDGNAGVFSYYTPTQVEAIVAEVCSEVKLLPLCSLKRNEYGLYQEMRLVDIEDINGDAEYPALTFTLATAKGDLRNTNDTQNMGSTDTYSERYIKMKVFQIKDNNLDPDAQSSPQNTKQEEQKGGTVIDDLDF